MFWSRLRVLKFAPMSVLLPSSLWRALRKYEQNKMTRKQSELLRERASGLKYISARQFVFFSARKMHYNARQSDKNYM